MIKRLSEQSEILASEILQRRFGNKFEKSKKNPKKNFNYPRNSPLPISIFSDGKIDTKLKHDVKV